MPTSPLGLANGGGGIPKPVETEPETVVETDPTGRYVRVSYTCVRVQRHASSRASASKQWSVGIGQSVLLAAVSARRRRARFLCIPYLHTVEFACARKACYKSATERSSAAPVFGVSGSYL